MNFSSNKIEKNQLDKDLIQPPEYTRSKKDIWKWIRKKESIEDHQNIPLEVFNEYVDLDSIHRKLFSTVTKMNSKELIVR